MTEQQRNTQRLHSAAQSIARLSPQCVRFARQARKGNSGTLLFNNADRSGVVGIVQGHDAQGIVLSAMPSLHASEWCEVDSWAVQQTVAERCQQHLNFSWGELNVKG